MYTTTINFKKISIITILLTSFAIVVGRINSLVFENSAHNFSPDESADFLTIVDKIKVESELVTNSSTNNNNQISSARLCVNNAILNYDSISQQNPFIIYLFMTFLQLLKNKHIGYVSAIIAAILFGSVSTITKPVLEDLNALSVSSLTYISAGLSLIPFMKFSAADSSSNFNNNTSETTNNTSNKKRKWWTNNNNKKSYFLLLLT
ncbi:MAG TPA: hypothetical protein VFP49_01240, partial [Nitrososphaeraceae archaeon]|nr:hypothetical protein [Nitrososphaeraceae archaeon]